jgi:protein-S-isoprenylcysteine O-methyltransferase Ste14
MLNLFFVVWSIDTLGFFVLGYSTVIVQVITYPSLLAATVIFLCPSFYIISKSHKAVLEQAQDPPKLVDSGVYAWVRHPMYFGTLLFCLAFMFVSVSLVSIGIWIVFFIFYDRIAIYEEQSLIQILGEPYAFYKKRVSKWLPGIW